MGEEANREVTWNAREASEECLPVYFHEAWTQQRKTKSMFLSNSPSSVMSTSCPSQVWLSSLYHTLVWVSTPNDTQVWVSTPSDTQVWVSTPVTHGCGGALQWHTGVGEHSHWNTDVDEHSHWHTGVAAHSSDTQVWTGCDSKRALLSGLILSFLHLSTSLTWKVTSTCVLEFMLFCLFNLIYSRNWPFSFRYILSYAVSFLFLHICFCLSNSDSKFFLILLPVNLQFIGAFSNILCNCLFLS